MAGSPRSQVPMSQPGREFVGGGSRSTQLIPHTKARTKGCTVHSVERLKKYIQLGWPQPTRHWHFSTRGQQRPAGAARPLQVQGLGSSALVTDSSSHSQAGAAPGFVLDAQGQEGSSLWLWAGPQLGPYESSPRISCTKAAMSGFLVLCKVKKGCSINSR